LFQEVLSNVVRHAQATRTEVRLTEQAGRLVLQVHDNGRGITQAEQSGPHALGLLGMRERAGALGGELAIEGTPGRGTLVTVWIPTQPA
jgi:signal transduction histidine kinase